MVAGAVPHKHHSLRRRQRRHLLAQGLHQLHIIAMTAQQRRAQRQALKARAHALHFANDLLVLVAVDNVQGLDRHILVPLLGQLLQGLQRGIDMDAIALLQFANNHPRGEGAEQRAVRAAGGQIALAGGDVLFAGVVIAGAKAHHQKCFFHILFHVGKDAKSLIDSFVELILLICQYTEDKLFLLLKFRITGFGALDHLCA